MMKRKLLVWLVAGALVLWGAPALAGQELMVAAAASLTNALKKVAGQFEKTHPGTRIVCNFAASGVLLQQMATGAPVDILAAADQKTMNQAQEKNLIIPGSRKNFVSNQLVLIAPLDSQLALSSLNELTQPEVKRVAVGNPATVPAGRYAQAALGKAGLWDKLSPRFIMAGSVRQVLDYVSRGEVDAGLVYATDAAIATGKVKVMQTVSEPVPIFYPVAVTATTDNKALALDFLDFVLSSPAQEIFHKFGFGKP
jgi:molybdate transport system substrate-binding protein